MVSEVSIYDVQPDIQSYKKDTSRKLLADVAHHSVSLQQKSYHTFPAKTLWAHQNQTFRGKGKEKKAKDLVSDKERFKDAEEQEKKNNLIKVSKKSSPIVTIKIGKGRARGRGRGRGL